MFHHWGTFLQMLQLFSTVEQTIFAPINKTVCVLRTHYSKVSIVVVLSNGYIFTNLSTGYGPSRSRLYFDGDSDTFPMWETRFINYLYMLDKEIHDAILPRTAATQEIDEVREKNRRVYAELVQVLDERSLQLIMTDCKNNGRAAFKVLCKHYQSTEKPRVLTLYEDLTTLRMTEDEDITDFFIRAERATTGLRSASETISDNLVIAMLLRGLLEAYKPFVAEHFTTFDESFEPGKHFIELADGRRSNKLATARGNAKFTILDSIGTRREITLKNTLFTPDYPTSLFSVRAATDAGAKATLEKQGARLTYESTDFEFVRCGKLYFLPSETTNVSTARTLEDWHIFLGQMHYNDINKLQSVTTEMTITQSKQSSTCTTCTANKMTKCPKIQDIPHKCAKEPLDRVHTDLCGPINPKSREGYKYIINFIDKASSMLFVYFLRTKDEAFVALKQLKADVAPIGRVKEIHSDNGGEYISKAFETVLRDNGIMHKMTALYSPYQNGKSERS